MEIVRTTEAQWPVPDLPQLTRDLYWMHLYSFRTWREFFDLDLWQLTWELTYFDRLKRLKTWLENCLDKTCDLQDLAFELNFSWQTWTFTNLDNTGLQRIQKDLTLDSDLDTGEKPAQTKMLQKSVMSLCCSDGLWMFIFIHGTSLICCTTSRIAAGHKDSASCSRTLQQGGEAFWRTMSLLLTHPAASLHANPANYIAPFWFFPVTPLISIVCPFLPPLICPLLTCWVWASQCQPAL